MSRFLPQYNISRILQHVNYFFIEILSYHLIRQQSTSCCFLIALTIWAIRWVSIKKREYTDSDYPFGICQLFLPFAWVHSGLLVGSVLLIVLVLCVLFFYLPVSLYCSFSLSLYCPLSVSLQCPFSVSLYCSFSLSLRFSLALTSLKYH